MKQIRIDKKTVILVDDRVNPKKARAKYLNALTESRQNVNSRPRMPNLIS